MKIEEIIKASAKPEIYTKGTASMWEDEHISKFLLDAHINPEHDLASRNGNAIRKTVDWIHEKAGNRQLNILDLGCGPGLYCELLAEKGHNVTGLDFSQRSIDYAKSQAKAKSLNIEYIQGNYLNLEFANRFDLIIMIYCDFGVLIPSERECVASNILRALKPGGSFIFDALSTRVTESGCKSREWDALFEGFWRPGPYLALSEPFRYNDGRVLLDQHIVIDGTGEHKIYRFWNHCWEISEMSEQLKDYGFIKPEGYENILGGDSSLWSREINFFKAEKPSA